MSEKFQQLYLKFQLLGLREKILLCVSALIVLLYLWYVLIHEPLVEETAQLVRSEKTATENIDLLQLELESLQKTAASDPNAVANLRFAELTESIEALNKQIQLYTDKLVTPRDMVTILRDMLAETKELKLLSLRSLEPQVVFDAATTPVAEPSQRGAEETPPDDRLKLYRHSVQIRLKGDYFTTLNYLRRLEELQRNVLWQGINYQVVEHPSSEITIEIYTLSFQRGVIGV